MIYCLIFEFDIIGSEIKKALSMWVTVLLPSVFPYLVLSDYITRSDIMNIFEKIFGKFFGALFKISPCSTRSLVCSLICGYPSGAISAVSLFETGSIDIHEAKRLICYTNNAGPLFLICAVGTSMLGSYRLGFAIYIIQIISAFTYAFLSSVNINKPKKQKSKKMKFKPDLCESVNKSVVTMLNICGFMVTSYTLSASVMILAGNLGFGDKLNVIIRGFFEISSGVNSLARPFIAPFHFALICAFVSWSGLSVILQIKSVSKNITDLKSIMFAKSIQAVLSFIMGYIYKSVSYDNSLVLDKGYLIEISLILTIILFIISKKRPLKKN